MLDDEYYPPVQSFTPINQPESQQHQNQGFTPVNQPETPQAAAEATSGQICFREKRSLDIEQQPASRKTRPRKRPRTSAARPTVSEISSKSASDIVPLEPRTSESFVSSTSVSPSPSVTSKLASFLYSPARNSAGKEDKSSVDALPAANATRKPVQPRSLGKADGFLAAPPHVIQDSFPLPCSAADNVSSHSRQPAHGAPLKNFGHIPDLQAHAQSGYETEELGDPGMTASGQPMKLPYRLHGLEDAAGLGTGEFAGDTVGECLGHNERLQEMPPQQDTNPLVVCPSETLAFDDDYPLDEDGFDALLQASNVAEHTDCTFKDAPSRQNVGYALTEQSSHFFPPTSHCDVPDSSYHANARSISGAVPESSAPDPYAIPRSFQTPKGCTSANMKLRENGADFMAPDGNQEMDDILLQADENSTQSSKKPQTPKLKFNLPRVWNNKTKQLSSPLVPQSSAPSTPSRGDDRTIRLVVAETPPTSPQFTSPQAIHPRAAAASDQPAPFIRPAFPDPLNPRSPIPGPRASPVLRVCFRLGEALRAAAADARSRTASITELYARVLRSERLGLAQHFQFADLYHWGRPPTLEGRWMGWKGAPTWEADGAAFLGALGPSGKVCRVVGRIERVEGGGGWRMSVLSAWEADWEDVETVKQAVCF